MTLLGRVLDRAKLKRGYSCASAPQNKVKTALFGVSAKASPVTPCLNNVQLLRSILRSIPFVPPVLVCRLLHTVQPCLFWTGERAELRISSVELLTEYRLARVSAYVEVIMAGAEAC